LFDQAPPPTIDGVMSDAREKRGDGMESDAISRRQMIKGVGLVAAGALLGSGLWLDEIV